MRHRKKYMFLLIALVIAFSLQIPVSASTTQAVSAIIPIQPFWANVSKASASLDHSGTTAYCGATITGLSGTTSISATMRLERVDGSSVTTVSTWTKTVNGSSLVMSESATVLSNGSYRVRVEATVVRNGVSEKINFSG